MATASARDRVRGVHQPERAISAHAANIVLLDHDPPTRYLDLFRAVFELRRPVRIHGDRMALMTSGRASNVQGSYEGIISTFMDLDVRVPWLNTATGEPAGEDETNEINIPPNLRPHAAQFMFEFNVATHRLVVQNRTKLNTLVTNKKNAGLGARLLERYLSTILDTPTIVNRFGQVEITIVPSTSAIDTILSSRTLRKITITVKPPNPDDLDRAEREILARLEAMNAKSQQQEFTARTGQSLDLDDEAKKLARVAAENGRVEAKIEKDERVVPISTVAQPRELTDTFNANVETERDAFTRMAAKLFNSILARR